MLDFVVCSFCNAMGFELEVDIIWRQIINVIHYRQGRERVAGLVWDGDTTPISWAFGFVIDKFSQTPLMHLLSVLQALTFLNGSDPQP